MGLPFRYSVTPPVALVCCNEQGRSYSYHNYNFELAHCRSPEGVDCFVMSDQLKCVKRISEKSLGVSLRPKDSETASATATASTASFSGSIFAISNPS